MLHANIVISSYNLIINIEDLHINKLLKSILKLNDYSIQ